MLDALELPTRRGCPRALESPEVSGETAAGIPVAAGAGDQAAGGARRRRRPAGTALGRPRHLRRRLRGAAGVRRRPAGARARVLPRRSRARWHAMGVMLSAAGSLRWLRDALGARERYDELTRGGRGVAAGHRGAHSSCRTSPASGRRTRTRTRAAAFAGLALRHDRGALVARRARGRRLRAARLARAPARARRRPAEPAASRAAARAASSGCGSSPRCSACPIERTAVEEGSAYGAALLGGVAAGVFRDVHEAVATLRPRRASRRARP